jgi:mannan endo-1,4-beta-mannosidase
MKQILLILMAAIINQCTSAHDPFIAPDAFVKVEGNQFMIKDKPYRFIGTNFWYGMHLGLVQNRARLCRELDLLQALGCTNLRIMVGSEGPDTERYRVQPPLMSEPGVYNEHLLEGLDFLLVEMRKRGIYGVLVLGNFWHWSGGFAQYLAWAKKKPIPYPSLNGGISWAVFMDFTFKFYSNLPAKNWFRKHIRKIIGRNNSISGIPYTSDPTIMSWQLANEPKCGIRVGNYRRWIRNTARLIKHLDPNHLISSGSEGIMSESLLGNRAKNYRKNHEVGIDYLTAHVWIQNWGWYQPKKPATLDSAQHKALAYLDKHLDIAATMNKPLVLEEFGIARDLESYEISASTQQRDQYYERMFEQLLQGIPSKSSLQGINFWAWGGEGRPSVPKSIYTPGDDLIGDPPHEYQGWYSVYDTDASTIGLIKKYNDHLRSCN